MSDNIDRGALFGLRRSSSDGFKLFPFRQRSATFPSTTSTNNLLSHEFSDTSSICSGTSFEGQHCESPPVFDYSNSETPAKPNIPNGNALKRSTQLEYIRSSNGESPNERLRLSLTESPIEDISHYNQESPQRSLHMQSSHWENTPHSTPIRSVFSNYASPCVTPMALYNGLHLPVRQLMNYNSLYPVYNGNAYYERNNWQNNHFSNSDRVEEMAKSHRNAASHADARHTWSGVLPINTHKTPVYSCKVFLGGVPWEMSDHDIKLTFSRYGVINVLRPGKDVRLSRTSQDKEKAGYLYLIFESDKQVKQLLNSCTHDFSNGGKYYFALNQPRYRPKEVQVIPWNVYDSTYVKSPSARVDANKTVFVGALHGMLTAEGLATILEDLFGGVVYVGIDTDKYKYPIGSGRVTFSSTKAYTKAVHAAFIDVKATRFQKKIQIDPFLEESNCSHCRYNKGPIFCRDSCMRYLCRGCWDLLHVSESMKRHQPLMRNKNSKF